MGNLGMEPEDIVLLLDDLLLLEPTILKNRGRGPLYSISPLVNFNYRPLF